MPKLHQQAKSGVITMAEYKRRMKLLATATRNFFEYDAQEYVDKFYEDLCKATPVKTGKLRDGWTVEFENRGQTFKFTTSNKMYYAPYVEYGHVSRDFSTWVMGRYMLTNTARHYERLFKKIVSKDLEFTTLLNLTPRALQRWQKRNPWKYEPNYNKYQGFEL